MNPFSEDKLITYFNNRVSTYGPSTESCEWNSVYSQTKRYQIICQNINPAAHSIIDVGCGTGDFFHYLKYNNINLNYTGIDISAKMIIAAQKAYPRGNFRCLSINECGINNKYDIVIASGLFNLISLDHLNFVQKNIKLLQKMAKKQLIINFLHLKKQLKKSKFYYYSEQEIDALFSFIKKPKTYIRKYLPNDITVVINL